MAIFTIMGLTLREAARRKTLLAAFLVGLLPLALTLLLFLVHREQMHRVAIGQLSAEAAAIRYGFARSAFTSLSLSSIKALSSLFAALLAGGAISGEIERGLMSIVLPRPYPRWYILMGKWLGINVILIGAVLVWTAEVWASLTLQTHVDLTAILKAGPIICLFPMLLSTLALSFSTFTPRLLGTVAALLMGGFAWFDGILNSLGDLFKVQILHTIADMAGLVVPQGYVGWWVEDVTKDILIEAPGRRGGGAIGSSPQFLTEWGKSHLHFAHLDALYVALYFIAVLSAGTVFFQRRDV